MQRRVPPSADHRTSGFDSGGRRRRNMGGAWVNPNRGCERVGRKCGAADAKPLKQARPRASTERTLAAAPYGAWLVRFCGNTVELPPRLAGLLEAKPCCTHGSSCHRGRLRAASWLFVVLGVRVRDGVRPSSGHAIPAELGTPVNRSLLGTNATRGRPGRWNEPPEPAGGPPAPIGWCPLSFFPRRELPAELGLVNSG
jgi:hypothetical protein